jgi:hypothetical protein
MDGQVMRASKLLWELQSAHPNATNPQLAEIFMQKFPNVRSTAKRVIWRWRGAGSETDYLSDEQVDVVLGEMLQDAGYLR